MTRSFWGFGYSSQPSQQHQPSQKQRPDEGRQAPDSGAQQQQQHAMIPPNGAFAPATTAITQGNSNVHSSLSEANNQQPGLAPRMTVDSNHPNADSSATMAATPSKGFHARSGNINIPAAAQIQGKLRVRVHEATGLGVSSRNSSPYVVVQCSTSEHISRSANTNSQSGNAIAIPTSRVSISSGGTNQRGSHSSQADKTHSNAKNQGPAANSDPANPHWQDEAIFDVTSYNSDVSVTIYDASDNDKFMGFASIRPNFKTASTMEGWYSLVRRSGTTPSASIENVQGQVFVSLKFEHTGKQHFGPSDFQVLRLIGKGTFGQVYQVRKRDSSRVYAMKVLSKRVIVREKEIAHTIGERDILVRTSGEASNFLVGLKFSFQTNTDLYLITDYMSGGELFWHLQREGRFSEPRARFYIAELIVALEHLHNNDIVYRDLKPENILLDASGHVALCDFGLSKANLHNGTTNTFCGTTEYLAPEVLLDDKGYTKMVDFWSLGVLIFEMCCGWSPFYAEDNQQMYKNIAFGKVRFPKDALSPEGRDFVKGLLNRNPKHRLGATHDAPELMAHPFFKDIDWDMLKKKQIPPPYKPHVSSDDDTSNFDPEFTSASTSVLTRNVDAASPLSPGIQDKFKGFTFVDDTLMDEYFRGKSSLPSQQPSVPVSASYRAPPPSMGRDEAIDLYDENEIKLSHSHYDSGIKHKFASANPAGSGNVPGAESSRVQEDDTMRMDEDDADMMDDDRNGNYDDFVEGQGFEM